MHDNFVTLFAHALGQTRIESLTLNYVPGVLDISRLLTSCPTLRHLEYRIDSSLSAPDPARSMSDSASTGTSKGYGNRESVLEILTVHAGNTYTLQLGTLLQGCPKLWRIQLEGFKRGIRCVEIMSHCPQLEVLWIGQAHFLVPKAWKMERKRTGRGVHGLRSLILGKNNHVSADDLDILFNNDHANLVALYITQSATASSLSVNMVLGRLRAFAYDGEGSADTAAQFISSSPCLAHIELQNCLITARLIKALSDAPHLESIALSFNSYDQETICMLLKSLSSRHLNRLYYKERGRTVVASILEAFTWVQTLEHITIDLVGPCAFDRDTAVSWVKRLLGSLTNLQSLTLIGLDRISNTFLNAIAVHSVGTRLTSLCLRECSLVTSEALEALAHHQTTTLREVSVERCYGLWGIMQLPTTGGRLHLIVR